MATAKPINIQVSDIINWFRKKELVVNETFQRHSVWSASAKTFLIDTILHELPIPKIYLRTIIDPKRQSAIREVVDGQQRIRTLVDFADNKFALSSRSEDFEGLKYTELDPELQEKFLGYTLTAEQLLNASDDDVIDIFARLNSYTVPLNAAEKRHAQFQSGFKFAVRKVSQEYRPFIEKFEIFSVKQRFRMADDAFFAEAMGVLLEGVKDGGERNITKLYERHDEEKFESTAVKKRLGNAIAYLDDEIGDALKGVFSRHYHVLMMIAAYAHHRWGIPKGDMDALPQRRELASPEQIKDRLSELESALLSDEPPKRFSKFADASKSSTHRLSSRKVRFLTMADVFGA